MYPCALFKRQCQCHWKDDAYSYLQFPWHYREYNLSWCTFVGSVLQPGTFPCTWEANPSWCCGNERLVYIIQSAANSHNTMVRFFCKCAQSIHITLLETLSSNLKLIWHYPQKKKFVQLSVMSVTDTLVAIWPIMISIFVHTQRLLVHFRGSQAVVNLL